MVVHLIEGQAACFNADHGLITACTISCGTQQKTVRELQVQESWHNKYYVAYRIRAHSCFLAMSKSAVSIETSNISRQPDSI